MARLSVIIPAYNSRRTLTSCLEALNAQTGPEDEVVVVDDASGDGSAAAAAEAGARVVRCESNVGAARSRNLGAREARGEYLFFLDADVVLREGSVAALMAAFGRGYDAVVGHYVAETPAPGFFSRFQNYYTFYNHDKQDGDVHWFWTAMGGVRRAAFEALGGFSEHFRGASAEDMQMGYELSRAGYKIVLDKGVRGAHEHRHTLASVARNDLKKSAAWSNVYLRLNKKGGYRHGFTGSANRVSLASAWLLPAALAGMLVSPWLGVVGALAITAFLIANAAFVAFVRRRAGAAFAAAAGAFLFFTFYLVGIGVARGTLSYLFGRKIE